MFVGARSRWRSASCQLWLARLPLPRLPDTVADAGLRWLETSFVHAGACGAILCCGSRAVLSFFVAIAVVAVGAAEPSVVVDGIALVFRLPRFLYRHGDTWASAQSKVWYAFIFCCRRDFRLSQLTDVAPTGLRDSICDAAQPLTPREWIAMAWPAIRRAVSAVSLPLQ